MPKKSASINVRKIRNRVMGVVGAFNADRIPVYAAQASFFIAISAVPFVMLLLHTVQLIYPDLQGEALHLVNSVIPPVIADLITSVVDELYGKVNYSVVSISAITLLWSAARGIKSIGNGVRNIFGKRSRSGFLINIIYSLIMTVLFVIFMVAVVAFIVFGKAVFSQLVEHFSFSRDVVNVVFSLRLPTFFALLTLLFWMAYTGMARTANWRMHWPGAFVSAAGWVIFSWIFSLYIDHFSNYSYVYGSLAAVVILMLWIYFCMIIFLSGAEINKLLVIHKEEAVQ